MNNYQQTTQSEVLSILSNNPQQSLFLTGEAGTGKSWLINHWLEGIKKKNPNHKGILLTAPTGIAAININGETLHRTFMIPLHLANPESQAEFMAKKLKYSRKKDLFLTTNTLLIDEISMVRRDVIEYIDKFLQCIRNDNSPFGGVRIIAVGDPFQLPPVVTKKEKILNPWFFQADVWKNIPIFELVENKRQEELQFANLLNHCRRGNPKFEHLALLGERVQTTPPSNAVILSPVNRTVYTINQSKLNELETKEFFNKANLYIAEESKLTFKGVINQFRAPYELKVKIGARIMLLNNDFDGRWVNGTMGTVLDIIEGAEELIDDNSRNNNSEQATIKIKLDNDKEVEISPVTWKIEKSILDSKGNWSKKVLATFKQYPITLGWAITVHKSQGLTLDKVHFDFSYIFSDGQAYVAMSRCRTLEGLTLSRPLKRNDIRANNQVISYMLSNKSY